jgi:hypothetical protein
MKKRAKLYLKFFGFGESDFIPCEMRGSSVSLKIKVINKIDNLLDNL